MKNTKKSSEDFSTNIYKGGSDQLILKDDNKVWLTNTGQTTHIATEPHFAFLPNQNAKSPTRRIFAYSAQFVSRLCLLQPDYT